jgi:hypothetical protein
MQFYTQDYLCLRLMNPIGIRVSEEKYVGLNLANGVWVSPIDIESL